MGPRIVIVTCAKQGAYLFAREGNGPYHQQATCIGPTVDESGAGDAFLAGLVIARQQGWSYEEAMPFGALLAGFAVTEPGGAVVKPTSTVMEAWNRLYPQGKELCHVG